VTGGADLRYSDRDVRDNPDLRARVVEYLQEYTGEFSFLIDCKRRVDNGHELTVGMVRGCLNCMRSDPRVVGLPTPQPVEENVIDLQDHRGSGRPSRGRSRPSRVPCTITAFHNSHSDELTQYCAGIYEINRDYGYQGLTTPVKIKPDVLYVAAKSPTALVHLVSQTGHHMMGNKGENRMIWYPLMHEFGWSKKPDQIIVPVCGMPRSLRNPLLLTQDWFDEMQSDEELCRARCGRCFDI
jgi:hypothetical protein